MCGDDGPTPPNDKINPLYLLSRRSIIQYNPLAGLAMYDRPSNSAMLYAAEVSPTLSYAHEKAARETLSSYHN